MADTNYGFLGGAGADFTDNFRADVGVGYFQQGKFDLDDVRGQKRVHLRHLGAPARAPQHAGAAVGRLHAVQATTRSAPMTLFAPEVYTDGADLLERQRRGLGPRAAPEGLRRHRRHHRPRRPGPAALQGVVKSGYARLSLTGIARNLNFVVRNVPGFIPFETLPQGRAERIRSSSAPSPWTTTSPSVHLTPGYRRRYPAAVDLPQRVHRRRRACLANPGRALAGRRVDLAVRQGPHADLPGARQPPLGHLAHALRGRVDAAGARQQRHPRRHGPRPKAPRRSASSRARTGSARRCRCKLASRVGMATATLRPPRSDDVPRSAARARGLRHHRTSATARCSSWPFFAGGAGG